MSGVGRRLTTSAVANASSDLVGHITQPCWQLWWRPEWTVWLTDKALQAQMIEQKNSENPVVIYSKSYCPFSNQVLLSRTMTFAGR